MIAGKLTWASSKSVDISAGKDTVVMAAKGRNCPLVVVSLLLEVS